MRRSQILAGLVSGLAMTTFAKRLLEHGPRYAAARLRGLASAPLTEGHVLMLHTGRSGSTVLGQMLDQHSGVFWDGELLEKRFHRIARARGVGVNHLYGALDLADEPEPGALDELGLVWAPHRSTAARLFWEYYRVAKNGTAQPAEAGTADAGMPL